MTPTTANAQPSSLEDVFHKRASFRALLSVNPSLVDAAEAHGRAHDDPEFTVYEALRSNLVTSSHGGGIPATLAFPNEDESAARQAATVISLQRVALNNAQVHQNRSFLATLVARDDVLLEEIEHNSQRLQAQDVTPDLRSELEMDSHLAVIARQDLAKMARVYMEQQAMREAIESRGMTVESNGALDVILQAGRERVCALVASLDAGVPLRRALAADLAIANAQHKGPAQSVSAPIAEPAKTVRSR